MTQYKPKLRPPKQGPGRQVPMSGHATVFTPMVKPLSEEAIPAQSDQPRVFSTGAHRDSDAGKPRLDLISPFAKERLGILLAKGAIRYGSRNWEIGMPFSQFLASAERHLNKIKQGDTSEDHFAALVFNIDAIMHGQEMVKRGIWPKELDDLQTYTPRQ